MLFLGMLKKIIFLLAVLVLLPKAALAYTNPGQPVGYVNDFANFLSIGTRDQLEQNLKDFELQTKHEVVIVTIATLDGDTIENFAVKLFEDWKIGKKGADNGILFLIAKEDRQMRIEVGYGLEGALPDATAYQITEKIVKPAFKNEEYDSGVLKAIETIEAIIKGEDVSNQISIQEKKATTGNILDQYGYFIFVTLFFLFRLAADSFSKSKRWWPGGVWGGFFGLIVGLIMVGFVINILWPIVVFSLLGLGIDYGYSKRGYSSGPGSHGGFWGGFGGGGGFGGFGGGGSGGGGSSNSW